MIWMRGQSGRPVELFRVAALMAVAAGYVRDLAAALGLALPRVGAGSCGAPQGWFMGIGPARMDTAPMAFGMMAISSIYVADRVVLPSAKQTEIGYSFAKREGSAAGTPLSPDRVLLSDRLLSVSGLEELHERLAGLETPQALVIGGSRVFVPSWSSCEPAGSTTGQQ